MALTAARSTRVPAGALGLHALVWGSEHDPPVVLLHGNGGHAHWWDALVPALVPGWRVIAPDLRGHGESDWPEPPRYRLSDLAGDLEAVVGALAGGPVVLVGHSMGGRVVLWYAAHHPEEVRALALLDTRLDGVDPETAARYRGRVGGARQGRGYPTRAAAMAAFRFVPEEPEVSPEVIATLAAHAVHARGPGDWTFRFDRAVLALDGDKGGDLHALLPRVACPTLVAAGAASWLMDETARTRLAAGLARPTVRVFRGGHHFPCVDPSTVGAALRAFLDSACQLGERSAR